MASSWGSMCRPRQTVSWADGQMDLVMVGRARTWPTCTGPTGRRLRFGEDKAAWVLPAPYAHWLERYRPN